MTSEVDIGRLHLLTPETLAEVEELVLQQLRGRLHDFRLSIRNGGLVLRGRTESLHAKQLAQHAILEITRAPITANEIAVRRSANPAPSDSGVAFEASLVGQVS
jgi:hypothetical protein